MNKTFFVQPCPTCGRSLHIQVQYLGKTLNCQHCNGKLMASEEATTPNTRGILERANALLKQSRLA